MSRTMKMRSKRDRMVVMRSMFSAADLRSSYRPKMGFAAASTEARVLSWREDEEEEEAYEIQ